MMKDQGQENADASLPETIQNHSGSGDNVGGDKNVFTTQSIQSKDLKGFVENILREVRYRELDKACGRLQAIGDLDGLEHDVRLVLEALNIKVELASGSSPSQRQNLQALLKQENLPIFVSDVVTSILIDLESRESVMLARERYSDSNVDSVFIREVFFERIASENELEEFFNGTKIYDFSEHELTGLVRGAMRVENFSFSFKLAQQLRSLFPSRNADILALYSESCVLVTKPPHKHYVSLSKKEKYSLDRLVTDLLNHIDEKEDIRLIATLTNLLSLTFFLDDRLHDLGKRNRDKIRDMNPSCGNFIDKIIEGNTTSESRFELVSDSLDLEQFALLDAAIEGNQIKVEMVAQWVTDGGAVRTEDEYIDSFFDLYLRASICPFENKREIQKLDNQAKKFIDTSPEEFTRLNPLAIIRLCERFLQLGIPLTVIDYLKPFLADEAWVSPVFECYLTALYESEKFDLFLSQIKHLEIAEKTLPIFLREAQVYERLGEHDLSIKSASAAIKLYPNNPYAWHLLLHVSRRKGSSERGLKDIVLGMPEEIFYAFDDSKVALINEIAVHIDANFADRVLVDWFVQDPYKVATPLTQIHANALSTRPQVIDNPYVPVHCGEGVTYSDAFETFTRILVRNVDIRHPDLLDIASPIGQILSNMKVGDTSGNITLHKRIPSYVAAFRLAAEMRSKGNDGRDAFRLFSLPENENDWLPYFENIIKTFAPREKKINDSLESSTLPLTVRGKLNGQGNPVKAAITELTTNDSIQSIQLFNNGEEAPRKVLIDVYTAVYFSLMGLLSGLKDLGLQLIVSEQTKAALGTWLEDILRTNYMSVGISDDELYKITSDDIRRDPLGVVQGIKELLQYVKVEDLRPVDTPDTIVKSRNIVDETVYSTLQLSFANNIPLLCIDNRMCELAFLSGCPAANMKAIVREALGFLSHEERIQSIRTGLVAGTPVPILYTDIIELSRSPEPDKTYLVFKFMEKYGDNLGETGEPLNYLTDIVRNITAVAYIDGSIFSTSPRYYGYAKHAFNLCCRSAMKVLKGETAEQRFATLIYSVVNTPSRTSKYVNFVTYLACDFAEGHFLDFDACNQAFAACHVRPSSLENQQEAHSSEIE